MALHLLVIAAAFGHRFVDWFEIFGKCYRSQKASDRSTICRIVNDRFREELSSASVMRAKDLKVGEAWHGWDGHDMDACSNERVKSIAAGVIPARHGSHQHTAAGCRRDWNSGRNQYPYSWHG